MKKSLVTLLAATTLAAAVVPAFATELQPSQPTTTNLDNKKAAEAAAELAARQAELAPFIEAYNVAANELSAANQAYNTIAPRFQAAAQAYADALVNVDVVRARVTRELEAQNATYAAEIAATEGQIAALTAEDAKIDIATLQANVASADVAAQAAAQNVLATANTLAAKQEAGLSGDDIAADQAAYDAAVKAEAAAQATLAEAQAALVNGQARKDEIAKQVVLLTNKKANDNAYVDLSVIDNNIEVRNARAAANEALAVFQQVEAEVKTVEARQANAQAAYDAALAAAQEKAYQLKLDWTPGVGVTALSDAAQQVKQEVANTAVANNGGNTTKGGNTSGTSKEAAKTVAAAKTATGSKALPKTSAAK